jgi:hypothetical protein
VLEHSFGDVACVVHNRLIARLSGFGEPGDERVTIVVPTAFDPGVLADLPPDGFETAARFSWIGRLRLAGRKNKPFRLEVLKFVNVPLGYDFKTS